MRLYHSVTLLLLLCIIGRWIVRRTGRLKKNDFDSRGMDETPWEMSQDGKASGEPRTIHSTGNRKRLRINGGTLLPLAYAALYQMPKKSSSVSKPLFGFFS